MDDTLSIPSLVLMVCTSGASFAALFYLFQRHIGGVPLLHYEPRRRVPWGPVIALVAVLIPLAGIVAAMSLSPSSAAVETVDESPQTVLEAAKSEQESDAGDFVVRGLFTSLIMMTFVVVLGLVLRDFLGADRDDLGLPANREQLLADIGIGVFACVAAMLPIYAIQLLLTALLQPETEHPMIDELQRSHTAPMMLVGTLMVVVAAPLFEEFSFRLLFQGWLEKWEDEVIGYSGSMRSPLLECELTEAGESDEPDVEDAILLAIPQEPVPLPRSGVLQDLPHGWLPILISGTFFGLAHLGHGVSPVPLVLFGIVLGYLYQRTHRLVPSITAHALFNAYSMAMLWLSLS